MKFKDPTGAVVIDLTPSTVEPVGGYLVESYDEGVRTWQRFWVYGVYMNDRAETSSPVLDGRTIELVVYIEGDDWSVVSARRAALLTLVETPGWQLEVDGITWVCYPADSNSPMPPEGDQSTWRRVSLSVPVRHPLDIYATEES